VVTIERKGSDNLAKSSATAVDQSNLGQAPGTKLKGVLRKEKKKRTRGIAMRRDTRSPCAGQRLLQT